MAQILEHLKALAKDEVGTLAAPPPSRSLRRCGSPAGWVPVRSGGRPSRERCRPCAECCGASAPVCLQCASGSPKANRAKKVLSPSDTAAVVTWQRLPRVCGSAGVNKATSLPVPTAPSPRFLCSSSTFGCVTLCHSRLQYSVRNVLQACSLGPGRPPHGLGCSGPPPGSRESTVTFAHC